MVDNTRRVGVYVYVVPRYTPSPARKIEGIFIFIIIIIKKKKYWSEQSQRENTTEKDTQSSHSKQTCIPILATFVLELVGLPGSDPQNSSIDFARTTNYTYTITTRVRAYRYMHINDFLMILSTARHPTLLGAVSTA